MEIIVVMTSEEGSRIATEFIVHREYLDTVERLLESKNAISRFLTFSMTYSIENADITLYRMGARHL